MGTPAIEVLIKGFTSRLQHRRAKPTVKSAELFYELLIEYYSQINQAHAKGRPLAWVGGMSLTEIFLAMDIPYFVPEAHAILSASIMGPSGYLEEAAGYGIPVESCSSQRTPIGIALKNEVPPPDIIVNDSAVCDGGRKLYEILTNYYGCPGFYLDYPYFQNQEGLQHYQRELKELIEFIEKTVGQKLNNEKLEEVIKLSKQAWDLSVEVCNLRKTVPSPIKGRETFRNFLIWTTLCGTAGCVEYFRAQRDELITTIEQKKGALPNEKHRLCWIGGIPGYAMNLFDWMEEKHGVTVVMDMLNYNIAADLTYQEPLEYLAKKSFYVGGARQLVGPIERAIDNALTMVMDYHADGVVFFANAGCRQGCGSYRTLRDSIQERYGLPTLILDGDGIDPSLVTIDEMMNKLEEFFEILEQKKV
jgi:benzoyl-CoA reductase/2-hydroxyglutaryl-CoA dehydratase subunit BcrC/BadD/HgdB